MGEFYDNKDADRARRKHLEDIISFMSMDGDNRRLPTLGIQTQITRERKEQKWLELGERFGPKVDMTGFEDIHKVSWQRQGHLFGVVSIMWNTVLHNLVHYRCGISSKRYPDALDRYKAGLSLGLRAD